jgi:hypothetical protein
MKNKNHCKDCTDRHINCHSTCERYKAWREELDKRNEKIREVKNRENDIRNYEVEFCRKNKRRKNK